LSDKKEPPSTDEGSPPQSANTTDGRDGDLLGLVGASMCERTVPVPQGGSIIDPFAPAAQPLNPPQTMDDPFASFSQPPLHPLQAQGGVADPFATVPRAVESQSGIGGTVDPFLAPHQQKSVSDRPNMHRVADPFAVVAPMSTPRELDVSDDDPFGLTALSSQATAGSHTMNANHSPMSHVQPRSNAQQDPFFLLQAIMEIRIRVGLRGTHTSPVRMLVRGREPILHRCIQITKIRSKRILHTLR
jgi:hypothetical protein